MRIFKVNKEFSPRAMKSIILSVKEYEITNMRNDGFEIRYSDSLTPFISTEESQNNGKVLIRIQKNV